MNPWEFAQSIGLPEILVTIASLVVTWMLTQLSNYISNKSEEVKNKTDNDSMKRYIEIATSTVTEVVDYLNHSVVNDLKIAASDGKLTQEEVDQIKATARVQVQSILSAEAIQALQQVYGDINALIDTWIVNAVAKAQSDPEGSGITSTQAMRIKENNGTSNREIDMSVLEPGITYINEAKQEEETSTEEVSDPNSDEIPNVNPEA
nr:MAG TPA: hypothetical protein [Caudoviricetes sp.]